MTTRVTTAETDDPEEPRDVLSDRIRRARQRRRDTRAQPAPTTLVPRPDLPVVLSSAQRRLWFLSQLEPSSAAYHIPLVLDLDGPVDVDALRAAWLAVVARHQVLRTRIGADDGDPYPIVDESADLDQWSVVEGDPDEVVRHAIVRPFNLGREQPWRVTVVPTDTGLRWGCVVHHVAADGWSVAVLLGDLARAYTGESLAGDLQYSDHARALHDAANRSHEHLDYWAAHLEHAPRLLELPTDRPRPAVADSAGATTALEWSTADGAALAQVARRTHTTPFMVLLAAWHIVLGRWSGADDTVIGVPVAGRHQGGRDHLVGCFVNTLALRVTSTPQMTIGALLAHVRDVAVEGFAHQDVAFEDVVDRVQPERDVATTPLFQTSLTVHTEPGTRMELPGLTTTWVDMLPDVAKVDVALHAYGPLLAHEGSDDTAFTVAATYRRRLFDTATVERMLLHLRHVVAELANADVAALVADLEVLTPSERNALPAAVGADCELADSGHQSVTALVRDTAHAHPDRIAVRSEGVELTYAQLLARADSLAAELRGHGATRGSHVAFLLDRSCDVVVAMVAAMTVGATYLPLDPLHPDSRLAAALESAAPDVVVSHRDLVYRVDTAGIPVLDLDHLPHREGVDVGGEAPGLDDVLYVVFTSGTTGRPKGVEVTHRHLLSYLDGLCAMVTIEPGWQWAMMNTPAADLGLTNLFGALTTGGTVNLLTYEEVTDPDRVADLFSRHPIDAMKLVPSHLRALLGADRPAAVLPRRLLIVAGEPCPWQLIDDVHALDPDLEVHNHYGPTEATVSTMGLPCPPGERVGAGDVVPLGRPFPGTRAHVLDAHGRHVPDGVPGELVLAGPSIARGYLRSPAQTSARFGPEPAVAGRPQGRAYRTGDRVRRLACGRIEFLGRVDDQVKVRGFRVEPGEIVHAARRHPAVHDCAVVARPSDHGTLQLVAYVVANEEALTTIREHLRDELPDYMVPSHLVPMTELPLTPNGKVDRSRLPNPESVVRLTAERPLAGPEEEAVAAVWRSVLGIAEVGPSASFFDVGGDSFSAVRVAKALPGLSVVDIFRHPTIEEQARQCTANRTGEAEARGLLRRLDRHARPGVHLVCVPYGGGDAITFAGLADAVPSHVAVHGVHLPGHDLSQPGEARASIRAVADALADEIADLDGDIVLYGHCLGGALAAETALTVEARGGHILGVVAAGTFPAARLPGRFSRLMDRIIPTDRWLSDRGYHDMLRSMGGFTDIDADDRAFLVGALRHDARQAESYYTERYSTIESGDDVQRLTAPILCVVGDRDRATELYQERFAEWQDFSDDVDLAVIESAGHFFLKHQAAELAAIMSDRIARWQSGERPRQEPTVSGTASTRTFLVVAITQLLSMIGTGLTGFGVGIWVLRETNSISLFSLIAVVATVPAILLMPVAGAIADRVDRRIVMLVSDGAAGVATLVLAVLMMTGNLELWFIYIFSAVGAVTTAFQRPAYLAAVTQLVPKRYLGQANGLVTLGTSAGDLFAALLGGMLVGFIGLGAVVAVDVVTFGIAFVVLAVVRFPNRLWVRREEPFSREILGGWRFIARRRPMVLMVVFFVAFNLLFAFPLVLITPLVLASHGPATLGAVLASGGIGAACGAVLMALWGGTSRRAIGMVGGTVVLGVGVVFLGVSSVPAGQAVANALVFGSLLVLNAHWLSLIQTKVGLELQGRVLAVNQMLALGAMPVGFLLCGPTAELVSRQSVGDGLLAHLRELLNLDQAAAGPAITLVIVGVITTVWGILGLATRGLRCMEDDLPDAIPDAVIATSRDELQQAADEALDKHRGDEVGATT